jgi:hypothetical protein
MATGLPKRWVTMTALVRSVIRAAIVSAVTLPVSGSTSAKTGIRPWYRIGLRAPMSVIEVVITSSPGSRSSATRAVCTAAVPDEQGTTKLVPNRAATSASSAGVWGPFVAVSVPDAITSPSSVSSSAPNERPEASWSDGRGRGATAPAGSEDTFTTWSSSDGHRPT